MQLCKNFKLIFLITVGYDGLRKGNYGVVEMGNFADFRHSFGLTHNFHLHTKILNFHCNKDNVQLPFSNTLAPVSLYYNILFSKNNGLASDVQQPFRTGSKHPKKRVVLHTGIETRAGSITKKIIHRVLNRPRSPEGRNPLVYFWFFSYKRKE